MKSIRFLFVGVFLVLSFSCFAKRVKLDGCWSKHRSIEQTLPMQVFLDESRNELVLQFESELGTVQVSMTDLSGETLYSTYLETTEAVPFVIPLDHFAVGEYTIHIQQGINEVSGGFAIY